MAVSGAGVEPREDVRGVVLAAGAGRRMGRPKIQVADWLERAVGALARNGLGVSVVVGAEAEAAADRVDDVLATLGLGAIHVVVAHDWAEGMGASLRAALGGPARPEEVAALVTLVDLPDVDERVVARLLAEPVEEDTLRRAAYDAEPGHPVLLGRRHWPGVVATARGDQGARAYLRERDVVLVECGDLATGRDVDRLSGPS